MKHENIEDIYPLSPMQQGMLFHTLYSGQAAPPLLQWSCRFDERLNVAAFRRAWQYVIVRHPILRTAVVVEDIDEPVQVVLQSVPLPWAESDFRELSRDEQTNARDAYIERDRLEPFQLSNAPLMRLRLLRLADQAYLFLWTFHLLLLDGWSTALVVNELLAIYEAFCRGEEPRLESRRPYRDYIAWYQRQDPALAESFWRKALRGVTAPTPLMIEKPSTSAAISERAYEEREVWLSTAATQSLQSFARRHRLTLNTLARAAWALLLNRYSGEKSVVFGAAMSGRPASLRGVESIAGLFVNTLPVRVDVPQDESVLPWLARLQEQQAELLQYEFSRLVDIQGWSDVPRGHPLFESILGVQTYPVDSSLDARRERLGIGELRVFERTDYPLTIKVNPGEEISLVVSFERARFDGSAIARMLGHFQTLLLRLAVDPARRISDISCLSEREQKQVLVEWNQTGRDYPRERTIHGLFEEQVERTPDAEALVRDRERLSYRELNERANHLARYLSKHGVGPEVLVGVYVERSLEMVVGLLGILKAGAAYVPLDPSYPRQRLASLLRDAGARIVLTQESLAESLPQPGFERIRLDADWSEIARESPENLPSSATPENLAYVIYTSGSTGTPKGVAVAHRSVLNLIWWHLESYGVKPTDRAMMLASPAFDASVWEIWPYLAAGASLRIPDEETRVVPAKLSRWLESEQISICFLPTSLAEAVLAEPEPPRGSLRFMLTGGDQLHRRPDQSCGFRLINHYGPTEATVVATAGPVSTEAEGDRLPSIGRPISNTRVYILDRELRPVPIGFPGELHIAGESLARGYLNRPELTAQKYLPDPFSAIAGARLYKTGDLARYRDDGGIEFLGRIDHQVKIRGFRIEPGEIESAIVQHPSVAESVVVAQEDVPGEKRLTAYVVARGARPPAVTDLRDFLKRTLPDYMIPSAFLFLEALPLTPSGKVDRQALPVPEEKRPDLEETFAGPRTPVEEILAGIWSDVLKIERIGVRDNFFELGGHSVLATRVFARIREHFGVDLPLRRLFEEPTVAGLAESIDRARVDERGPQPPPLRPVSRAREVPLSFAQQRLWFIDQLDPGSFSYNTRCALRLTGTLDYEALQKALSEIASRHESLRTTFRNSDGRPIQIVSDAGPVALPLRDVSSLRVSDRETEALRLAGEEVKRPFDLARGPLLRASLYRIGPQEHILVLVIHHIVCDGWSMGVLFRELEVLYRAFSRGEPSPLPPVSLQFADYAVWEREWLHGKVLEKQLSYWTSQLRGIPAVLDLRGDRPRPAVRSLRGARHRFALPTSVAERIAALSRNEGVTLYMTLLAAFAVLLWRQTGQEQIVVGSPISGRNRVETEDLIGLFINTIVLRADLRGNPSFRELMLRVRETALGAYTHQEVPLERLVDALKLERSLSHNPLFQVWFVLQNAEGPPPVLAGLSVSEIALEAEATRHDLQLSIAETSGGLTGELDYATDLFDPPTIARLARRFDALLHRIVAQPESRLDELGAELEAVEEREREENRRQLDAEMRRRLEIGKRRTVRG